MRRLRVEEAPQWINKLATKGGQLAQYLGVLRPLQEKESGEEVGGELKRQGFSCILM